MTPENICCFGWVCVNKAWFEQIKTMATVQKNHSPIGSIEKKDQFCQDE
jgi:hypothetical protein